MGLVKKEITSAGEWDSFVLAHAPQALFQSWKWGEVEKSLGHRVWRYGWREDSKLIAIAQIQKITAKRGTFLHVRHGPILIEQSKKYWDLILTDLSAMATSERAWFIRVSPQLEVTEENKAFFDKLGFVPAPIHAMDAELCLELDVDKSEEEILTGMRKTTRYEIRLAQKLNVTVDKSTDPHDLRLFFDLYNRTSERQGFVPHKGIQEEFEVFAKDGNALLLTASHEGRVLASAVILFWGEEAIYHHGASVPSRVPASHAIQWEAIREAKRRGKTIYNFWGIAPDDKPNHPWRGHTVFKTGFGGRITTFLHAQDYPVHPLYVIPKTIETIRRHLKGY